MHIKWFGNMLDEITNLIEEPILKEISTLQILKERYSSTLKELDEEILKLEQEFNELTKDLVTLDE